ncbi:MAG: SGNH/GDSL hydrolase family protein [Nitrospinae bacterium]|nr:SGNH/GDSL hydrolase family protein [Nitrospinota bacterium]
MGDRFISKKSLLILLALVITVLTAGYAVTLGYEPRYIVKAPASADTDKSGAFWKNGAINPVLNLPDDQLPLNIPGPLDAWGGSTQHTVTLNFTVAPGKYRVKLEFYDCHESQPPSLDIKINDGPSRNHQLKPGKGAPPPYSIVNDALTFETPVEITSANNRISITNLKGSWAAPALLSVYDDRFNPAKSLFSLLKNSKASAIVFFGLILSLTIFLSADGSFKKASADIALLTVAVFITLIMSEAIFRIYLTLKPASRIINAENPDSKNKNIEGANYTTATMIDVSPDPDIPYVLKPNLRGFFAGHPLNTNSFGMRGDDTALEKPANTIRILGLGDSVMFGWGLDYEDSIMPVLARKLHEKLGVNVEALNTSVPSYNTHVEAEVYRRIGRKFKPDIVVLLFVGNDFGFPSSMVEPVKLFTFNKSYIREQLRRFLIPYVSDSASEKEDVVDRNAWTQVETMQGDEKEKRRQWLGEVERYYEKMTTKEGVATSLQNLSDMLEKDGAKGVLLYHPSFLVPGDPASYEKIPGTGENINEFIKQVGNKTGLYPVDMTPVYEAFVKFKGKPSQKEALWLDPGDPHPIKEGHEMMAEEVVKVVVDKFAPLASGNRR